jgi:hypothetical protein
MAYRTLARAIYDLAAERDNGGEISQWWKWVNSYANPTRGTWFASPGHWDRDWFSLPKEFTFNVWKKKKEAHHGKEES